MAIGRRSLLKGLFAAGAAGGAARALGRDEPVGPRAKAPASSAERTEERWREEFAATYGDGEQHGYAYHCVNCQGNCAWEVWVKDGKITRENQSAQYPAIAP